MIPRLCPLLGPVESKNINHSNMHMPSFSRPRLVISCRLALQNTMYQKTEKPPAMKRREFPPKESFLGEAGSHAHDVTGGRVWLDRPPVQHQHRFLQQWSAAPQQWQRRAYMVPICGNAMPLRSSGSAEPTRCYNAAMAMAARSSHGTPLQRWQRRGPPVPEKNLNSL